MDDKNELSEYKYDEAEAVPSQPIPDSAPSEQGLSLRVDIILDKLKQLMSDFNLDKINWRRMVVPGMIVVSILFLYMFFGFYTSKKTRSIEQAKISEHEKASLMPMQPIKQEASIAMPPIDIRATDEIKDDMQQKMDEYMSDANETIANLNEQISKTQQEISVMNQKIEQLMSALQQVFLDVEKLKAPPKKVVKKRVKVPVAYHVRAMVPGRVWLESADGKNVTLRVGDRLAGYGEVRMISPKQGMVVMSNGSIIQYGVNDY